MCIYLHFHYSLSILLSDIYEGVILENMIHWHISRIFCQCSEIIYEIWPEYFKFCLFIEFSFSLICWGPFSPPHNLFRTKHTTTRLFLDGRFFKFWPTSHRSPSEICSLHNLYPTIGWFFSEKQCGDPPFEPVISALHGKIFIKIFMSFQNKRLTMRKVSVSNITRKLTSFVIAYSHQAKVEAEADIFFEVCLYILWSFLFVLWTISVLLPLSLEVNGP